MNNNLLQVKLKERLNKGDSGDYPNLAPYQIIEAFNKAMDSWVRRQLEGINQTKTGAEGSTRRIDDLQMLLTDWSVAWTAFDLYWESNTFPDDYLEWCILAAYAQDKCKECPPRLLDIYLGNEADRTIDLKSRIRQPSYSWGETFSAIRGNKFRIYTNGEFDIVSPVLTYYRTPIHIQIAGANNPDTGLVSSTDVECELKDTVIELIIDEAAAIISGELDNYNQQQDLTQRAEYNN